MIIMDDDPERLVKRIIERLDEEYKDIDTKALIHHWYMENPEVNIGRKG